MAPEPSTPIGTQEADLDTVYFDPRVKCCTYSPPLPNFLVGRILVDRDPEMAAGRARVEARIAGGAGVSPVGLAPPLPFDVLYERTSSTAFGRSAALLCPYYRSETGSCGIWRHRQSVCTTWFCKHVRGAVGQAFWTAMRHLLDRVERALAAYCVLQLNPGADAVRQVVEALPPRADRQYTPADVDDVGDARRLRAEWGAYAGRERAFYEAAAELVTPMTWDTVARIAGAPAALAAINLQAAYKNLTTRTLPECLCLQPMTVSFISPDAIRVTTYSAHDPLTIPTRLADALHVFDGRPTDQARAAMASTGLTVERGAIQRLVDFDVLAPHKRDPAL